MGEQPTTRELAWFIAAAAVLERRLNQKFYQYFRNCDEGCRDPASPRREDHARLCRALYVPHARFMAVGAQHRERLFLKANRVGGTATAAYEATCHLTGLYPPWWAGKRFERPVRMWVAGDTMLTSRDILQQELLGPIDSVDTRQWSGMVPSELVVDVARKGGGVPKCVETIWVKHKAGGASVCEIKSYDQGQRAFYGTEIEVLWLDEEPPPEVYTEGLMRTMTTNGIVMATLTPLEGLTPFIQDFLATAVTLDTDGHAVPAAPRFSATVAA